MRSECKSKFLSSVFSLFHTILKYSDLGTPKERSVILMGMVFECLVESASLLASLYQID